MAGNTESGDERPLVIIKRYKRIEGGHHGGAWKIAYADFVTAMMAFFLVMWIVTSVSKQQRAALFEYFKNPSMQPGHSVKPAPGQNGPGGASTSVINLGGALDAPRTSVVKVTNRIGAAPRVMTGAQAPGRGGRPRADTSAEHKRLEALMRELRRAIAESQALKPFKDQLLLDIMPEGLRIQIVDSKNRAMFDVGSARLKAYTVTILRKLAPFLASVPNRISIAGHTDATPYRGSRNYTNWELSADRANAARRVLVAAGLPKQKIARIVGLADSAPIDRGHPFSPVNRRISIIVMTRKAASVPEGLPGSVVVTRIP